MKNVVFPHPKARFTVSDGVLSVSDGVLSVGDGVLSVSDGVPSVGDEVLSVMNEVGSAGENGLSAMGRRSPWGRVPAWWNDVGAECMEILVERCGDNWSHRVLWISPQNVTLVFEIFSLTGKNPSP